MTTALIVLAWFLAVCAGLYQERAELARLRREWREWWTQ